MDAKEGNDVATIDISGYFIHDDMKYEVNMKLEVKMSALFANTDPQLHEEYVTMENRKKVLYFRLKENLYRTVQATLLSYKKITKKLKEWGFELNPYDTYIENKTIDGK